MEIETEMQEAKVYFRSLLAKKRPPLERKSIAELKELRHLVRDKKWETLFREPYMESHGEAASRLSFFEIIIGCVIEDKREGVVDV